MKNLWSNLLSLLLVLSALVGCRSPMTTRSPEVGAARGIRNNCYGLLHELLEQEKRVALLRFIKREESDVKQLVKRIASACAAGANLLEEYAARDQSISLDDTWLPAGETATRESIAASTRVELLHRSGDEFELTLLLTQNQALGYAEHLAKVAEEHDSQPDRIRGLNALRHDMEKLRGEVFTLLLSRSK